MYACDNFITIMQLFIRKPNIDKNKYAYTSFEHISLEYEILYINYTCVCRVRLCCVNILTVLAHCPAWLCRCVMAWRRPGHSYITLSLCYLWRFIIPIIIKSIVISNAKGDVVHWYKLVHVVGQNMFHHLLFVCYLRKFSLVPGEEIHHLYR